MTKEMEGQISLFDQDSQFMKMLPEPFQATKAETGKPSSRKSSESQNPKPLMCLCLKKEDGPTPGSYTMKWADGLLRTDCTMLNFGECPNAGKESLWSLTSKGGAAAEILFEQYTGNEPRPEVQPVSESMSGDFEQSRTQRENPAGTVRESTSETSGGGTYDVRISSDGTQNWRAHCYETEISRALDTGGESPDSNHGGVAITYGISAYDSNAMKSPNPNSGVYKADTARTLDNNGGSPACNQGGMAVVCLNDQGNGWKESETMYTLNTIEQHAVFENHCQDSRYRALGDTCSTLATNLGTGGNNQPLVVKEPVCIGNGQADQTTESELVGALNCMHDQQAVMTFGLDRAAYNQGQNALFNFSIEEEKIGAQVAKGPGAVCAVDCRNGKESEINATLQADADHNTNSNNVCRIEANVRRLTPTECSRLQGFPDKWLDIGDWYDSKGKLHKDADSPKYKALGNSIAIPFWFWLLRRISAQYTRQATLGSLFSGIGGFDLCWELCNGPGTSRFVSEIEPFCVALLKRRFGDDETGEKGDAWKYLNP